MSTSTPTTPQQATPGAVHSSQHMRVSVNLHPTDGSRELFSRVTQLEMQWVLGRLHMQFAMREMRTHVPRVAAAQPCSRRPGRFMGRP